MKDNSHGEVASAFKEVACESSFIHTIPHDTPHFFVEDDVMFGIE